MAVKIDDEPETIEIACRKCGRKLSFTADDVEYSGGESPSCSDSEFGVVCPAPKCKEWNVIRDFGKRKGRAEVVVSAARDRSRGARIRGIVAECGATAVLKEMVAYYRGQGSSRADVVAGALKRALDDVEEMG